MKKLIAIAIVAGVISLGFNAINDDPETLSSVKSQNTEKTDFSHKLDEKRLACWD